MLCLIEMIHTKIETGILYKRPSPSYYTLFVKNGLGLNIVVDENYVWGIMIEKNKFKSLDKLQQTYIPDGGDKFTIKQKRKILKFLFKEF